MVHGGLVGQVQPGNTDGGSKDDVNQIVDKIRL